MRRRLIFFILLLGAIALLVAPLVREPAESAGPQFRTSETHSVPEQTGLKVSPEQERQLTALRRTYQQSGTSPSRILLQEELAERWAAHAPVKLMLRELADLSAPADYRVYIAKALRMVAKTNVQDAGPEIAQGLRALIQSEADPAVLRARFAFNLIDIDASDETLTVIAKHLRLAAKAQEQDATLIFVGALTRSTHQMAKATLWQLAQQLMPQMDTDPRVLEAAIMPLCYEADLPLESLLQEIASHPSSPRLRQIGLRGLQIRTQQ